MSLLSLTGQLARDNLRMAYDLLWKTFEQRQQKVAGELTKRVVSYFASSPEARKGLLRPTLATLGTLVQTGVVSVPQAVNMAIAIKNFDIHQQMIAQDYLNKQALGNLYKQQIELAKARIMQTQAATQSTVEATRLRQQEQIDRFFTNLERAFSGALMAEGSVAGTQLGVDTAALKSTLKFIEGMRLKAYSLLDQTYEMRYRGKEVKVPYTPRMAIVKTMMDADPTFLGRVGLTQEDLARVWEATGLGGKNTYLALKTLGKMAPGTEKTPGGAIPLDPTQIPPEVRQMLSAQSFFSVVNMLKDRWGLYMPSKAIRLLNEAIGLKEAAK